MRPRLRAIALPPEHGSWGFLIEALHALAASPWPMPADSARGPRAFNDARASATGAP